MTRALLPPAVLRRRGFRAGGILPLAAWSAALWTAECAFAHPVIDESASAAVHPALPVAFTVAVIALATAVALLVWTLRARRTLDMRTAELQRVRADTHALQGLLDVWQWRTDADHQLVEWRAPRGSGFVAATGGPVWTRFVPVDGAADTLRDRFVQHVPLDGVQVVAAARPGEAPHALWLHGTPTLGPDGRFAGYLGTARPRQETSATLLSDLVLSMPIPALRVAIAAPGQTPSRIARNAASDVWFAADALAASESQPVTLTWAHVLQHLPAPLRTVVEQAAAHPSEAAIDAPGGWNVRTHLLPCPATDPTAVDLLMVFHRTPSAAGADAAAAPHVDDSESFSYTVSHDLRAPIRVVEGFAKIVKEDYGHALDRIGNDHLDRVLAAAARMNSMIDSLLALSQLSSRPLARQPVNLSLLAGYIVDDLRRQTPEREVEVHIEPGLQVHGDATLLRVVLENLLGNAWKYTGKCRVGRIWFEASEHEGRPAITVRDNGAGFDMRFADRLFGVFQRLHSANDFQGTGVGLASVRRIIRRHGGDIWAEAEVDRGARFQFWI